MTENKVDWLDAKWVRDVTMSALHDADDQEATAHGNLMDLVVVEVERESAEAVGSHGERRVGETAHADSSDGAP